MTYEVELEDRLARVEIRREGEGWWVRIDDGPPRRWEGHSVGAAEWLLRDGEQTHAIGVAVTGTEAALQVDGHALHATVQDPRKKALAGSSAANEGAVRTPMPGVVVRINAAAGKAVVVGDVLLVVEAMKMENEYRSPIDGVVTEVHVEPGQPVDSNALLVTVSAP